MVYWKIDDETIRCLINKDEITQLGYDVVALTRDSELLGEFLQRIIEDSHKYIQWNTDNGIQKFFARALPADQFLLTISCTFQDDAINQDLSQIKRMFDSLKNKITPDRINEIHKLTGEEKEKAFQSLSQDLRDAWLDSVKNANGQKQEEAQAVSGDVEDIGYQDAGNNDSIDEISQDVLHFEGEEEATLQTEDKKQRVKKTEEDLFPDQKVIFKDFASLTEFCSMLPRDYHFDAKLYKHHDCYQLVLHFDPLEEKVKIITFLITAEEYGAVCEALGFQEAYLEEHAKLIIESNALQVLKSLA